MSFWNKIEKPATEAPTAAPQPPRAEPVPAAPPSPAPVAAAPVREPVAPPPPAPAAGPLPNASDLRLGRGVKLEGKLTFSGTVRVDASFQGSIVTDGVLVVGEGGKVQADITCGTVIVEGEVTGNVVASAAVELRPTARMRGDVETPSLAVERGAFFEGSSRRPGGIRAGKAAAAPATH